MNYADKTPFASGIYILAEGKTLIIHTVIVKCIVLKKWFVYVARRIRNNWGRSYNSKFSSQDRPP